MSISNRDIYTNALVHIGESIYSTNTSDYEARAPYLIAAFCSTAKALDKQIRSTEGLDAQSEFSPVSLTLSDNFPLCDRLASTATLYVASILVIDEDAELSDSLYDKYCDNLASIAAEIDADSSSTTVRSTVCESISEKYFFD